VEAERVWGNPTITKAKEEEMSGQVVERAE